MATQAALSTELYNTWLSQDPATQAEGVTNFVTAYDNWAKTLKDDGGSPITGDLLTIGLTAGAIAMLNTLNASTGTITIGSHIMELAIQAYWGTGAAFGTIVLATGFSTETTSTPAPPTIGSLEPPMITWANSVMVAPDTYSYTRNQAADAIAGLLYTSTLTVLTTIVGFDTTSPPTGPLPKTSVTGIG